MYIRKPYSTLKNGKEVPLDMIEPHRPNLWVLSFPDDFDIPEYTIQKVSKLKHYSDGSWKKITITLLDLIGVEATRKFLENINHIPLKVSLKKLDPTGVCTEIIDIFSKTVDIDFGKFDYSCDDFSKIKITIIPTKVQMGKNEKPQ